MNEAAAKYAAKSLPDFVVRCFRVLIEKCFCRKDDATQAEATLRRFFSDESLLDGVRVPGRAQSFQGHNLCLTDSTDRSDTGAHRPPVHDDGTGAALSQAASEFGPSQMQFVGKHIKQRRFRINVHG